MKRLALHSILISMAVSHSIADINEWTAQDQGDDWELIGSNGIRILSSGIFKFESVNLGSGALESIGDIVIDNSVTGTVTLYIERSTDNNSPGAVNIDSINLTNTNMTPVIGNLQELRITGNLGVSGPIVMANFNGLGAVIAVQNDVLDSITINNDFDGDMTADAMGDITIIRDINSIGDTLIANSVGNITIGRHQNGTIDVVSCGDITIGQNFEGSITADSLGDVVSNLETGTAANGDLTVNGNFSNSIHFKRPINGTWTITDDLSGTILIGKLEPSFQSRNLTGSIVVGGNLTSSGWIQVTGDLAASGINPARIAITGDVDSTTNPPIRVWGSITGSGAALPNISVGGQLGGTIAVDGSLADTNGVGDEFEIEVGSLASLGAIAINADGNSSEANEWTVGATIRVDAESYNGTDGNNTTDRVWNVSRCRGDFNGDRSVNSSDNPMAAPGDSGCATPPATAELFCVALNSHEQYRSLYPGLEMSRGWHGDCNFSGGFLSDDETAFDNLLAGACCALQLCPGDVNLSFSVDLTDLAVLLSNFGSMSSPGRPQGNFDNDGDVDLADLSILLSNFGGECCSPGGEPLTGGVSISISGFNTSGYTGGGFAGEIKHFVFDAIVTISTGADDWAGSGVSVTAANGATFRLVPSPGNPPVPGSSVPDKYATFFSVPYAVNMSNRFTSPFPSGGIAGEYNPTQTQYIYDTDEIDAAWYDINSSSNDGPAAVFRLVINVDSVTGANTGGGFGSVYWVASGGSPGSGDIKVADMTFDVDHVYGDSGASSVTGSFYVTD